MSDDPAKTLRLEPATDEVWQLTLNAAADPIADRRPIQLRCRSGGCVIAQVGTTAAGPLFTSSWEVERAVPYRIEVNGQTLGRSAARRYLDQVQPVTHRSGAPVTYRERHGVVALLALPNALPADYPDLLVRCKHGDALLDRREVIGWHRAGKAPKILVAQPRFEYEPLTRPGNKVTRSHETRRFTVGTPRPLDDLRDRPQPGKGPEPGG